MDKKGYMFLLDAVLAVLILFIGSALIYYYTANNSRNLYNTDKLADDIVGVLFYTQISDLCITPGEPGCSCPNYQELDDLVCSGSIENYDTNLLGMMSEIIEKSSVDGNEVKQVIKEIFVDKNVIDEKRFGFALLYSDFGGLPLELYNSEED